MAEESATSFVMFGARSAMRESMPHIAAQVEAIERAVSENTGLAFDLAKTLIESACRTILSERGISFDPADDLPRLFRAVTNNLPFLPLSASSAPEVRRSLAQTLSGLSTALQGVCELRNQCGFASHGTEGPRPVLESIQALLAAETADAIVGFLHRVHKQDIAPPPDSVLAYEDSSEFNDYVDDLCERVKIFDEEFEPSRILFELAPEPYRVYLTEYQQSKEEDEGGATEERI